MNSEDKELPRNAIPDNNKITIENCKPHKWTNPYEESQQKRTRKKNEELKRSSTCLIY